MRTTRTATVFAGLQLLSFALAPSSSAQTQQVAPRAPARVTPAVAPAAATPAVPNLDPAAVREDARRRPMLSAADRARVLTASKTLASQLAQPVRPGEKQAPIEERARTVVLAGGFDSRDVEAIAFLVIFEATKSAQEDLKAIMAQVKAIQAAKRCKALPCVKALQPTAEYGQREIDKVVVNMKNDLDSLSEMGEMESLRMQMVMDRLSKMMTTLSNLLKKMSDTAQGITQNLK